MMENKPYTIADVARMTGRHPSTVRMAIKNGQIPSFRFGRLQLVPKEAFDKIMAQGAERPVRASDIILGGRP